VNPGEQDERTKTLQEKVRTVILTQKILQEMLQEPCTEEQHRWTEGRLEQSKGNEQEARRELAAILHQGNLPLVEHT
jgi:hypothetical protein